MVVEMLWGSKFCYIDKRCILFWRLTTSLMPSYWWCSRINIARTSSGSSMTDSWAQRTTVSDISCCRVPGWWTEVEIASDTWYVCAHTQIYGQYMQFTNTGRLPPLKGKVNGINKFTFCPQSWCMRAFPNSDSGTVVFISGPRNEQGSSRARVKQPRPINDIVGNKQPLMLNLLMEVLIKKKKKSVNDGH